MAHSAKISLNLRHQKILQARPYHHANFQQNQSTIERFTNNFNFFSIPEQKNRDEFGAELVREKRWTHGVFLKMPDIIYSVMQKPFIKCVIRQKVNRFLHSRKKLFRRFQKKRQHG